MSKYTTGELAKLCGVSVRTVQYYDARNILVPSELSEGGRRLYSEEDLQKLKIICFLREAGLSISGIGRLFADEDPAGVISILLEQQEKLLNEEQDKLQKKLDLIGGIKRELRRTERFSVQSIGDIAQLMETKKKLRRVRAVMLSIGILTELIELGCLLLGFILDIWWPALIGLPVVIALGAWLTRYYYKEVDYICPKCHAVFKPGFREYFFANHTPTTRKLTCTHCGRKGFCVETYRM